MFLRAIWDKKLSLIFKHIQKFTMFLKTNLGYLPQIALKNMQLLVQIIIQIQTTVLYSGN